jgi:XTP/dITP diphosphohydrolase
MIRHAMQLATTIIASTNPGKIREFSTLLGASSRWGQIMHLRAAGGQPLAEESGNSYVDNAVLKAQDACEQLGRAALGDDGGIEVLSLGGVPGLKTARFTRAHGGPTQAMRALAQQAGLLIEGGADLRAGEGRESTPAAAHCAVALALPDGRTFTGEGSADGTIRWPPLAHGPGLFPLFRGVPPWDLHAPVLLHRARAFEKLLAHIDGAVPH